MTPEEKEKIKQFMTLVLWQLHPEFNDYPLKQMKEVVWSHGEEFEGTEYANNTRLLQAYYMNQVIETL